MAKASTTKPAAKVKQRVVGATVLIAIFVIIVLILPSQQQEDVEVLQAVEIPPKPENLSVKVLPIEVPKPPREPKPVKPTRSLDTSLANTTDTAPEPVAVLKAEPEPVVADTPNVENVAKPNNVAPLTNGEQGEKWVIQVGSFSSRENAEQLRDRLKADNYKVFVQEVAANGASSFRVNVGPNPDRSKLEPFKVKLEKLLNHSAIIKAYEP